MIPNRTLLIFSAAALFAGCTAAAQMRPGDSPAQSAPSQQPGLQQSQATGMNANTTASFADQSFVSSVFESDVAEVQLGQLALQKSQSPDVKQLGQSMVANRTKLSEQLKPIADNLNISQPKKPSKKDRQLIAKLETLSGPQFDQEYIKAVAKDNQEDVKNFQSEAQAAQDPNLQLAAKQDAGVLAQHQQAVEKIAQTHNVTLDAKK
jgi:putative membrane protein